IATTHKIFHNLDLRCVQLLTEPDHTRSHKRAALRALRQTANVMLMLISSEFTTRTACHENVAVDLHHLISRYTRTKIKIVDVVCNEQKFFLLYRKFTNSLLCVARLCLTTALPSYTLPIVV